jgi:hypothetical protein
MRNVVIACCVLMLFAATASAGELAVSKSTLGSMGLSSMQVISDADGLAVRGKGTSAAVWGGSQAQIDGQFSQNFYQAAAQWHGAPSSAVGGSLSFAAKFQVEFWADPTGFTLGVAIQGGISGGGAFAAAM